MQHDTIAHNFPQMAHWVNYHSWILFIWHGISHSSYSNNVNAIQDTRPSSQNIVGTQDLMVSPKADDNNLLKYDLGENTLKLYILTWRVKWGLITWNIPLDLYIGFSTSYWNHLTPLNIFFYKPPAFSFNYFHQGFILPCFGDYKATHESLYPIFCENNMKATRENILDWS